MKNLPFDIKEEVLDIPRLMSLTNNIPSLQRLVSKLLDRTDRDFCIPLKLYSPLFERLIDWPFYMRHHAHLVWSRLLPCTIRALLSKASRASLSEMKIIAPKLSMRQKIGLATRWHLLFERSSCAQALELLIRATPSKCPHLRRLQVDTRRLVLTRWLLELMHRRKGIDDQVFWNTVCTHQRDIDFLSVFIVSDTPPLCLVPFLDKFLDKFLDDFLDGNNKESSFACTIQGIVRARYPDVVNFLDSLKYFIRQLSTLPPYLLGNTMLALVAHVHIVDQDHDHNYLEDVIWPELRRRFVTDFDAINAIFFPAGRITNAISLSSSYELVARLVAPSEHARSVCALLSRVTKKLPVSFLVENPQFVIALRPTTDTPFSDIMQIGLDLFSDEQLRPLDWISMAFCYTNLPSSFLKRLAYICPI